jgi:hypothetical protein
MSLTFPRSRTEYIGLGAVILLMIALFLPVVSRAVGESADYMDHIRDARLWAEAGMGLDQSIRPHFFYHLLVIAVHALIPGIDWPNAAVIVGTGLYILLALIVYALVRPVLISVSSHEQDEYREIGIALVITTALMLVTPVTLLTWNEENLYLGYIGVHTYHNPTQIALKPFALLFFLYSLYTFSSQRPTWKIVILTFALGIASTLSKPNLAICLIPAVGLLVLYQLVRKRPVQWLQLIVGVGTPVALVLVWQFFFHSSKEGGFAFDPFMVMEYYSPGTLPLKFVMSILFPAAVTLAYFRQAREDSTILLAWLAFGFSVAYIYLLSEPSNWTSGNFLWSGQITLFILFVVLTLFFIRQIRGENWREWGWRDWICAGLFGLHMISGVMWYIVQLSEGIYARW